MPPPIWKNPIDAARDVALVPFRQRHHVLDAGLHRVQRLEASADGVRGEDVAERRVLPAGHEDRQVRVARRQQPAVARIDLVERLEHSWSAARGRGTRAGKQRSCRASAASHSSRTMRSMRRIASSSGMQVSVTRLRWRSSSACSSLRRQIAVMRHALVVRVRHQVEDVLLEVGAGAADRVHLARADHLGERDAELRRAHRAGERDAASVHRRRCGGDMPSAASVSAAALKWRK